MGTRHLITVVVDGQYKVAQYGQWDGYPSATGVDILSFLVGVRVLGEDKIFLNRPVFESKVRALRWATEQESEDADLEQNPQYHRDTGSGILELIQTSPEGMALVDNLDFVADGLFCEWAYVIDLDRNTFEVFKGFNKSPLGNGERFYFLQEENKEYYPAKFVKSWSLDNLPPYHTFLVQLGEEDDNEDITGMEPGLSQNL